MSLTFILVGFGLKLSQILLKILLKNASTIKFVALLTAIMANSLDFLLLFLVPLTYNITHFPMEIIKNTSIKF